MTELPTLREALREDAARHYRPRRLRAPWRLAVPVLATGLATLAVALVALDLGADGPQDEVVAASPTPTVGFATTPAPGQTPPPVSPSHADGPVELAAAVPVAPDSSALDGLIGGSPEIVRAWYVRRLKGHVILSRRQAVPPPPGTEPEPLGHERLTTGRVWCLSAPDPATDEPDIERGSTCGASQAIELGIGSTQVVHVPDDAEAPQLTLPDGTEQTLQPTQGLVVILSRPDGSRVNLRP
jgi:hypothetical protein